MKLRHINVRYGQFRNSADAISDLRDGQIRGMDHPQLKVDSAMATFEGWTFAAARGASRRALLEIADAAKIGPGVLEDIERARDVQINSGSLDMATLERLLELYGTIGFKIYPRTIFTPARLQRVQ